MQRILSYLLAVLLFTLVVAGCKKGDDTDNTATLSFERTNYVPFETALINADNLTIADGEYTGVAGNTSIRIYATGNVLITVLPDLGVGAHTLKVSIAGKDYTAGFNLQAAPTISGPDAVMNSYTQLTSGTLQTLTQYADSLQPNVKSDVLSALQGLQHYNDSLMLLYNNLSAEEKLNCVRFIAANFGWLNELHEATTELLNESFAGKTANDVYDTEETTKRKIDKFVAAERKVVSGIRKTIGYAALGFIAGSVLPGLGSGVGAAIGAGVGIGILLSDLKMMQIAQEELLDYAFMKTQQLTSWKTNAQIAFEHMVYGPVNVSMEYRSVYVNDKSTTEPLLKGFVDGLQNIKSEWAKATGKISISSLFAPKTVDDRPTFVTASRQVNSRYLSITNPTNSKVQLVGTDKTEGYLQLKFKNTESTVQSFNFSVNYQSPLGSGSSAIDATVSEKIAYSLIGNWHCSQYLFNNTNGFDIWYSSTDQCQGNNYQLIHHTETTQFTLQVSSASALVYDRRSVIYEEQLNQQCAKFQTPINNDIVTNAQYTINEDQTVMTMLFAGESTSQTYTMAWHNQNSFSISAHLGDDYVVFKFDRD